MQSGGGLKPPLWMLQLKTPVSTPTSPTLRVSMLSWVKGKLGFSKPTSPDGREGSDVTVDNQQSEDSPVKPGSAPEVLEEILAAPQTAWSRPSFDFRESRTARNALGSSEMLRTSSEPPNVVPRRRRAREFVRPRNTDFYKDMAGNECSRLPPHSCAVKVGCVVSSLTKWLVHVTASWPAFALRCICQWISDRTGTSSRCVGVSSTLLVSMLSWFAGCVYVLLNLVHLYQLQYTLEIVRGRLISEHQGLYAVPFLVFVFLGGTLVHSYGIDASSGAVGVHGS